MSGKYKSRIYAKSSGDDEFYTFPCMIHPIANHLKPGATVWCPFDTVQSYYVKVLEGRGFKVVYDTGDFFSADVPECDYIVSNPPFSQKNEVIERLAEIGKPWAMLFVLNGIFDNRRRFEALRNKPCEILQFYGRGKFFEDHNNHKGSLKSLRYPLGYLCSGVLSIGLVLDDLTEYEKYDKVYLEAVGKL